MLTTNHIFSTLFLGSFTLNAYKTWVKFFFLWPYNFLGADIITISVNVLCTLTNLTWTSEAKLPGDEHRHPEKIPDHCGANQCPANRRHNSPATDFPAKIQFPAAAQPRRHGSSLWPDANRCHGPAKRDLTSGRAAWRGTLGTPQSPRAGRILWEVWAETLLLRRQSDNQGIFVSTTHIIFYTAASCSSSL